MQWAMGHNQGYPPTGFGGGFLFSQTASIPVCPSCAQPITGTACWGTARRQHFVPATASGMAYIQVVPTPSHDYRHSYFAEPGFPETRQLAMSVHATYAPVYGTNHSTGWKAGREQSKPYQMPQPQNVGFMPYERGPPQHYQALQQYTGSPNFRAPVLPPPPRRKLTRSGPRAVYSKCTGKKKAVCIGINYTGMAGRLKGCINDAKNVCKFLIRNWNFKQEDIRLLTDDARDARGLPTKANILNAMKWLVQDARAHDSLFIHYSGHGGQIRDRDGDEVDGFDEYIVPLDHEKWGIITDDGMNKLLVRPIPAGCRLTALFDSCHSGSVLDLVYLYHSDGQLKNSEVTKEFHQSKSSAGDVISFSGCKDGQTSADVVKDGLGGGAMSDAFIKCLKANPKQSYQQLLKSIRKILRKYHSQKPQLSSSQEIDTNRPFVL